MLVDITLGVKFNWDAGSYDCDDLYVKDIRSKFCLKSFLVEINPATDKNDNYYISSKNKIIDDAIESLLGDEVPKNSKYEILVFNMFKM